ncbi:UvrD-helicase domain-containing protein [Flexivirga sp. ID2601S]|uniref:RecBCD enzyme subunit RecB n=1 Tax=Flexivirga aerilata TaxID=1656889 RepID=A0A849AP23_9MICO|nr:UvrD-helicase domain-containing protein [Flexivirga aerilata]NNG38542.1 UvrD-helicase domain-containing protein [Flexivirga aerilata]
MSTDTGRTSAETAFDIRSPLPTGTTVLEASAGTGKTWTIAALVTRYVAEGVHTLDELLVVTFGRAASQELRERVREQLVAAREALDDPEHAGDDPLTTLLLDATPQERVARAGRLREALASFDEATIATIHQFCQRVLDGLGIAGDTDADAQLVDDLDDLLVEVVDDLYVRGFAGRPGTPEFGYREALHIARTVVGDPEAVLLPADAEPGSVAARRVGFATAVRAEMARRKRRLGLLSYDDLLSGLAGALRAPDAPARDRMRRQWKVVLIDEFQDTDPVQWEVFDRAFNGHATMVLIGDPKQAIYAFRGGDVVTYLQAAGTAGVRHTLATNWRSDRPLVDAVGALLGGSALGDPQIRVHDVRAHREASRLAGAPVAHPFRLRIVDTAQVGTGLSRDGDTVLVDALRPFLARDAARDIARLLTSGATYDEGSGPRPLRPSDVAVLAATNAQLAMVQEELRAVGIPAVVSGAGSVFHTPAARAWRTLLEAMDQPHRSGLVRAAALTPFFGVGATELDERGDELTDEIATTLRVWSAIYGKRGIAAVFEAAGARGLPARVLGLVGGERELTDLRHVAEALHAAGLEGTRGLPGLIGWLHEQSQQDRPASGDARARRLDSDAQAVQLSTIHGSKGLEYPVVYLPFAGDRSVPRKLSVPLLHQPAAGGPSSPVRSLDVGGEDAALESLARAEDAGESLRLFYVAVTRAKSQVVAWWPRGSTVTASALHRLLLDRQPAQRDPDGRVDDVVALPDSAHMRQVLDAWALAGGPRWELADDLVEERLRLPVESTELTVRDFTREIDTEWRRTSYSALSRAIDDVPLVEGVGSEPEVDVLADEPEIVLPDRGGQAVPGADLPSPMADLPVGATFGSLVHAVLELADPEAADLRAEVAARVREQLIRWPVDLDQSALVEAILPVYDTPLGPLAHGETLRTIGRNRLAELDFEIPLVGGDDRDRLAERVTLGEIAAILRRHLPPGDPLLPYADLLDHEVVGGQVLRGYLTGSIDVVLRFGDRYLVADYKTNWLGPADQPLLLGAYGPDQLAGAMGHSDYPLQALLYAVVLHRYLRWRLPGYTPEHHLGGVLYLYLRGMAGEATPIINGQPTGVFSWRPPTALVTAISDLLDGRSEDRG